MQNDMKLKGATKPQKLLYSDISDLYKILDSSFQKELNRSIPLAEMFVDRWERAKKLGFGEKTSIYDSSFVFGDVKVGSNCWIGPNTVIDGSG